MLQLKKKQLPAGLPMLSLWPHQRPTSTSCCHPSPCPTTHPNSCSVGYQAWTCPYPWPCRTCKLITSAMKTLLIALSQVHYRSLWHARCTCTSNATGTLVFTVSTVCTDLTSHNHTGHSVCALGRCCLCILFLLTTHTASLQCHCPLVTEQLLTRLADSPLITNGLCGADTDLEDSDIEPSTAPFSPHTAHEPVVAESWGLAAHPESTTSALPSDSNQPQQPSSTTWQTHWLQLRIHALRQQQQRYESKLQRLRQQGQQPAESAPLPLPLHPQHPGASTLDSSHQPGAAPTAQDSQAAANSTFPQSVASGQATVLSLSQPPSADPLHLHPGAAASFPAALHQQAGGEPRRKRRHSRQQMPGLSMPEIARHPFFSQHGSAEPASSAQQLASEGGCSFIA